MKHNLSNLKTYPKHHVWVSSEKLNVFSGVDINVGDDVELDGKTWIVLKVDNKQKANEFPAPINYFELTVKAN